ncbi:MAG: hypothetical protein ACO3YZ_05800 [Candidatus Nanopelagicaceae bacterium]
MNLLLSIATSLHMGFEGEYNQTHPHFRLEHNNYAAGVYLNSIDNVSSYLSYNLNLDKYFLEVGAVTGYNFSIVPMVRAGTSLNPNIDVFISPSFENSSNPKVVLGLEFIVRK